MLVVIISRAHLLKLKLLFEEMTNLHSHLDFTVNDIDWDSNALAAGLFHSLKIQLV